MGLRRPRWRERLKANAGGYFWMPCPICGASYGGHEKPNGTLLLERRGATQMTCPQCPGHWIKEDGHTFELQPALGEDNELYVARIMSSSTWAQGVR